MKRTLIVFSLILFLTPFLSAQKKETITVKAGSRIQDNFPIQQRYRYLSFTTGNVYYQSKVYSAIKLNFNFLTGGMEFLHSGDTLSIANPEDIKLITVNKDTFYYDNGYLELLSSSKVKVAIKQYFKFKEVQKKDSYGNSGTLGATDAYSTYQSGGLSYNLVINRDMVFEKISEFYVAVSDSRFFPFTKKQILKFFPLKKDAIQDYLKSNNVDFHSKDDLLKLADYLCTFKYEKLTD